VERKASEEHMKVQLKSDKNTWEFQKIAKKKRRTRLIHANENEKPESFLDFLIIKSALIARIS
jgi:hypothetical protein